MSGILFGLFFLGVALLLAVVLPIASFIRAREAKRIAATLQDRVATLEARIARLSQPAAPALQTPEPLVTPASAPATAAVHTPPVPSVTAPSPVSLPPVAPIPPLPPITRPAPSAPAAALDLEQQIGSRWLLFAGIAAVVLGMSYFVKFAFDNGWISEPLRVLGGVLVGAGLIAGGMRFWSRGLALFGQALAGGGFLVLYVSIYAALHFYRLIPPGPAFALMVVVTAAAAWLADRQRSQPLAALALVGGFATPLLVGGERGSQVVLFTYIAILISGNAVLARRHNWPLLSAASYVCTFQLVIAWFFGSYDAALWLRTELFLVLFAALFGYLLWTLLVSGDRSPQAQIAIAALATAPLAFHLASIILLHSHPGAWLVYLILITVVGLIVSQRTDTAWLRVLVLVLVGVPALVWLEDLPFPTWYAAALGTTALLYALHLLAQWEAADRHADEDPLPLMEVLHSQINGLLLPLSLYLFLESRAADWNVWMVAVLSAWNGVLALAARQRAPRLGLPFTAVSATLAASAVVLAFDGPAVAVGWAAEGVFVAWLGLRERSRVLGIGGAVLIALGANTLAGLLSVPLPVGETPGFNPRALAAVIVIGLLAWLAWRMRNDGEVEVRGRARDVVIVLANLLGLLFLSAEIHALYAQRGVDDSLAGVSSSSGLAEQLTLSVTWALYAVVLIAIGISRRYAPARYFAILLFGVTVAKVLMQDIAGLDRFYRMLTVLAVGVLLLVASFLYQRRSLEGREP